MPPTGVGALLVALAFIPGWLYLTWASRLRLPAKRTALHETFQLIAIGLATTGPAVLLFMLVPHRWLPFTIDLAAWVGNDGDYRESHLKQAALTVILVLGVAIFFALLIFMIASRKAPHGAEFPASGSVWVHAIGDRPTDVFPWVGIAMLDGSLVEGFLHSQTTTDATNDRDIALTAPVYVSPPGQSRLFSPIDRIIVPAREIRYLTVRHVPKADLEKANAGDGST